MREINAIVKSRGVRLDENGGEWVVNSLVCADDKVLMVAESQEVCRGWRESLLGYVGGGS